MTSVFFSAENRTQTDVYGQAASNLVAGNNLESTVQQILDMGGGSWDRDTVIRALRAAFNNPERAVEYLYSVCLIPLLDYTYIFVSYTYLWFATTLVCFDLSIEHLFDTFQGIPAQAEIPPAPQAPATGGQAANPLAQTRQEAAPVPATGGPNANPLNLFPQVVFFFLNLKVA